jgi:nucleoside phosphorylase
VRILIVDDSQEKTAAISNYIKNKIDAEISFASTATGAKTLLKANKFDIMLLDIVLPYKEDEQASRGTGIRLLKEIQDRARINEPQIIILVTQFEDVSLEFNEEIRERLLNVIKYSNIDESWQAGIDNVITEYSRRIEKGNIIKSVDICFVCALDDPEAKQLLRVLDNKSEAKTSNFGLQYYEGSVQIGANAVKYVLAVQNNMGAVAAGITTTKLLHEFNPRLCIMVGICAGVGSDCGIGDIMIASHVWNWEKGKHLEADGKTVFSIEPTQEQCSKQLEKLFRGKIKQIDLHKIYTEWKYNKPNRHLQVKFGPIASGAAVIASGRKMDEIRDSQNRKMIALEMEGYGFYSACRESNETSLDYVMVKSVSDSGNAEKNDEHRDFAAYTASAFVFELIKIYVADMEI